MFIRILCVAAATFFCGGLAAARVIYGNPSAATAVITIPEEYAGMTATFMAVGYGYQGGSNMGFNMALYNPGGQKIAAATATYVTAGSDAAFDMFPLLYTASPVSAGNYTLQLLNTYDQKRIDSYLCIVWEAAGDDVAALQADTNQAMNGLRAELEGKLNSKAAELQEEINKLKQDLNDAAARHDEDQAALIRRIEDHERQITELITELQFNLARLERQQTDYLAQLEMLKVEHGKDVEMLNLQIGNLDGKYAAEVAAIKADITGIEQELNSLESRFLSGDQALKSQIDSLSHQHNALQNQVNIAETRHGNDVAAIQAQIDAKTLQIQTEHQADVRRLEQSIGNIDSKYATEVSYINNELTQISNRLTQLTKDYQAGDVSLKSQIDSLLLAQIDLRNQLTNLSSNHDRDVTDLQKQINEKNTALTDKINTAVADLRMEMVSLENRHREDIRELKENLAAAEVRLEAEINKLEQADRDIYDEISGLKEKQADYYARLEVVRVTHEKDLEALQKELEALERTHREDVGAINDGISQIQAEADKLKEQHEKDVAAIRSEITAVIDKLDGEVKKIYLELEAREQEFIEYQAKITQAIDDLQTQMTLLDKAVTERLKNLENRIRYAVYSDEKLAGLVREYTLAIQDKETEIADLELEIRELEETGKDATAKREQCDRKLDELLALRNELTDIEFAIRIRNDDSEFAVHEAEIESLKAELAALRNSSELLLQQLEEKLIETEKRLLALLEEARETSATENAGLKKELDDFKALVQVFIDTLREEQLSGDDVLRKLIAEMDESHQKLLSQLNSDFADRLEKLKFEQDVQFENLRSTINNIAYQQRFSGGGSSTGYGLPAMRVEEVPSDNRDQRVSPTESLDINLN